MAGTSPPAGNRRESGLVGALFAYSFLIATSYLVARTAGDSLFLTQIGNVQLPLVFLLASFATVIVAWSWYSATKMLSVGQSIQASSLIFCLLALLVWYLLPDFQKSFGLLAGIYLLAEVKGCINAINVVSAMNFFLPRDRRHAALTSIGLAAPIAAVVTGSVLAAESTTLSLRDWLLVSACTDLLAFAVSFFLSRQANERSEEANAANPSHRTLQPGLNLKPEQDAVSTFNGVSEQASKKRPVDWRAVRLWLGILIASKVILFNIVSFEFKVAANTYFESDSEKLVQFFGTYHGIIGLATILIQLTLTGRLLKRQQYNLSLLLMPSVLVFVAISFVFSPVPIIALALATAGKSMEAWRRSIHDTTLSDLYSKVKKSHRRFTIALNGGVIKPLAEVLAATVIFLLAATVYRTLLLVFVCTWIFSAIRLVSLVQPAVVKQPQRAEIQVQPPRAEKKRRLASGHGQFPSL